MSLGGRRLVRVTTVFKRLLRLDDVNVTDVEWYPTLIVVTVVLRRRRLWCPHCDHKTALLTDLWVIRWPGEVVRG